MFWSNDSKIDKEILSKEQDILTAVQPVIELLRQLLTGQATLAKAIIELDRKVNIIMGTVNNIGELIKQTGAVEVQIEADLSTLATNVTSAITDLTSVIQNQGANSVDDATKAILQNTVTRLSSVDAAMQALSQSAKAADPGAPIVVTTSGTPASPTV